MSPTADNTIVHLSGPDGSSAQITLFGAHVVSFKTGTGRECFFMSSKSSLTGPDPIRGGIPICWPAFAQPDPSGPFSKLGLHGFARQQIWTLETSADSGSSSSKAVFTLRANEKTKVNYPHEFKLTYTVEIISGEALKVTMQISNPQSASSALPFQFALHNYFRLPGGVLPTDVSVGTTLQGLDYKNLLKDGITESENRETFTFDKEGTGKIYSPVPQGFSADFGGKGGIKLEYTGDKLQDLVTFQPGEERGNTVPDLHSSGWKEFVCFEPARIHDIAALEPGQSWTAEQTITCF